MNGCPHPFVTAALHFPAHAWALSGEQQVPSDWQTSPEVAHEPVPFAPHATSCPQLLVAVPQVFPAHVVVAGSGLQPQLPAAHDVPPSHPRQSTWFPQLS
jgi:hypothetical protein